LKKFKLALIIFALFIISSSIFASSITPSIIINGVLPEKDDIFLIKYGVASSLDLDSGYLNISDTDFVDNTETDDFLIYVGNYTADKEVHTLRFSTVGFKKIDNGSPLINNNFTFDSGTIPLINKIYISFTNEDISNLSMSLVDNSMHLIKGNTVSNSLTVDSSASYIEAGKPGYTLKFSWESESDTGVKVPAGDYVAQITVEYINQN
jgi:hypothetical protein